VNELERQLKDALATAADLVEERSPRPLPAAKTRQWRLPAWLAPVCAAIAVLLLAVGLGVLLDGGDPEPVMKDQVPSYFLDSRSDDQSRDLEIRDTFTGEVLSDWEGLPRDRTFTLVTGPGDGRSFYTVAEPTNEDACGLTLYKVAVSSEGRIEGVAPSTMWSGAPGWGASSIALSPDGAHLALTLRDCELANDKLMVLDLTTGAMVEYAGVGDGTQSSLSWSADGKNLYFVGNRSSEDSPAFWKLAVGSPAGPDLFGLAHEVYIDTRGLQLGSAVVSPDEQSAITVLVDETTRTTECAKPNDHGEGFCGNATSVSNTVAEVSLTDGRQVRTLARAPDADPDYKVKSVRSGTNFLMGGSTVNRFTDGVSTAAADDDAIINDFSW
jgi:hypothetical protein